MAHLNRLRQHLRQSLWFVPALLIAGFVLLAVAVAALDRELAGGWGDLIVYQGSAEGAKTILSTVATAMMSLAVLVFTITLVVLQLASSQLSPRVMPLFLQERMTKLAMGVFLGTFSYALTGLWFVRSASASNDGEFIPVMTVTVVFASVGVSVLVFLNYVHRVGQSIRVESVAATIGRQSLEAIGTHLRSDPGAETPDGNGRLLPSELGSPGPVHIVPAPATGLVAAVSPETAVRWAREHDSVIVLKVRLGTFVVKGSPIATVAGRADGEGLSIEDVVTIGGERSIELDPAYGLRELVDIAIRALSQGINEPGVAVIVLDRVYEILREVGTVLVSDPVFRDEDGSARAVIPQLTWDGWVSLALREIIDYGGDSAQVCDRLTRLINELLAELPHHRHDVLLRYAEEVRDLPGSASCYLEWTGLDR